MKKITGKIIFLIMIAVTSGKAMDDSEEQQFEGKITQVAQINQNQPIPGGMDHAFRECVLPPELWEKHILPYYMGSLYHLTLVCKKFYYFLEDYRYNFNSIHFSNADFDSVMKNPCVLSFRIECKVPMEKMISIISDKDSLLYFSMNQAIGSFTYPYPDKISLPKNLRYFSCPVSVEWNLSGLSDLTYLDLSSSTTSMRFDFVEQKLTNLTYLNLSNRGAEGSTMFSGEGIGTLPNLTVLDLSFLGITSIRPEQFLKLTKLEKLNLQNTHFSPYRDSNLNYTLNYCIDDVFLRKLTNLTWLNLTNTFIGGTKDSFSLGSTDDKEIILNKMEYLSCNCKHANKFIKSPGFNKLKTLSLPLPAIGSSLAFSQFYNSDLKIICQLTNLTELDFRPICYLGHRWEFNSWKGDAILSIIWALWPHNLRILNGYYLPEKTLLNKMQFQAARDIIEKEYEIEGIIRRDLKFREYKDGEEMIGAATPIIFAGMIAGAIGGIYCLANYVNNK